MELTGQILGWMAALLTFCSYQCKEHKKLIVVQSAATISMCLSYLFMGALSGMALNIVCIIRNFIIFRKDIKFFSHRCWAYMLAGVMGIMGAVSWQNPMSLLIIIALMVNTVFLYFPNVQNLRRSILVTSTMILVYDVYFSVWGGVMNELIAISSSIIGLYRYRKNRKSDIVKKGGNQMKKTIIFSAIFLSLFTAVAVGLTFGLISADSFLPASGGREKGIDIYGTFDENDLLIEEIKEKRGKTEVVIPQISGLENKKVQEKVNSDIYAKVQEALSRYAELSYANYYVRGNFANVLSISYNVSGGEKYEQLCLNYELVQGNELKIEDLFAEGTDLLEPVRKGFYASLVRMGDMDYETYVSSYDENELYCAVKGFMESKEKKFTFSPSRAFLYYGDYSAEIDFLENADNVVIYSKYMTGDIFERDDIGFKGAFTCSEIYYEPFGVIEYGYAEDNLWYDITAWQVYIEPECPADKAEAFVEFKDNLLEELKSNAEKYREKAKQNPDKMYIVLDKPNLSMYRPSFRVDDRYVTEYTNAATLNHTVRVYEMDRDYFEKSFRDELINAYRYRYFAMAGGAYLYVEENPEVTVAEEISERLFNYVSGEEYMEVADVFTDDSYLEVLQRETKRWLIENIGFVEETLGGKVNEAKYSISTWGGIKVTFPDIESHLMVDYDKFEKETVDFFD